jgi:hypothetical protein
MSPFWPGGFLSQPKKGNSTTSLALTHLISFSSAVPNSMHSAEQMGKGGKFDDVSLFRNNILRYLMHSTGGRPTILKAYRGQHSYLLISQFLDHLIEINKLVGNIHWHMDGSLIYFSAKLCIICIEAIP